MQQKPDEKIDPLTRIQEEIKEVVRREEEYRQLVTALSNTPTMQVDLDNYNVNGNGNGNANINANANANGNGNDSANGNESPSSETHENDLLVTAQPVAIQTTAALLLPVDSNSPSNMPSLASSVNSNKEESLDEHHSDDSGISASSLSIKSNNNNFVKLKHNSKNIKIDQPLTLNMGAAANATPTTTPTTPPASGEANATGKSRYIGPNCYSLTPKTPQQMLLTRTISTPQVHGARRQFAFNGPNRGAMQRFIASRGKMVINANAYGQSNVLPLSNGQVSPVKVSGQSGLPSLKLNTAIAKEFLENGGVLNTSSTVSLSPMAIERDSEGKPLRRGYVPVEQKIQRELQDQKSRETELKRLRKINRQKLKQSMDKLQLSTDDEADVDADDDDDDIDDDSEVEHCYGPGKLRNAQSTMELDSNDAEHCYKGSGNRSLNMGIAVGGSQTGIMRPAMSLAQLCDLTPEEAPSSHRLIAQWESLIKKNAENATVEPAI